MLCGGIPPTLGAKTKTRRRWGTQFLSRGDPTLIWSDPVNLCTIVGGLSSRARAAAAEAERRRWISLIFAGWDRMVMIRRELSRTSIASLAVGLSHRVVEDSPSSVPRLRLALS